MKIKVIINKLIPLKDYTAITIWPLVFARRELRTQELRHEKIHWWQHLEEMLLMGGIVWMMVLLGVLSPWWFMGVPFTFYLWYVIEWLIRWAIYRNRTEAYYNISFEQEAYNHQGDSSYLDDRLWFSWLSYLDRKTMIKQSIKQK